MIRTIDIILSFIGLIVLFPLLSIVFLVVYLNSGSPLFFQKRVGRNKKPFVLVKFRTMKIDTESTPTHLVDKRQVTLLGKFLRKSKIDELPQLWNVLKGDMSLVGARPCLFTQQTLIDERERLGVFNYRPGITGLGQIRNVDMSEPSKLAKLDFEMCSNLTIKQYLFYIFATLKGAGGGDAIK